MATRKNELKNAPANIMSQPATKLETTDITPSAAQKEIDARMKGNVVGSAVVKAEVSTMVNAANNAFVVADEASGRGRAFAIVTLMLMLKHKAMLFPSKRNLEHAKINGPDFNKYLTNAFAKMAQDWDEMKKKSNGVNQGWTDAVAGYTWLCVNKCLRTDLDEKVEGNMAHLGLCKDKDTGAYTIALDIDRLLAAGVEEVNGVKVRGPGGVAQVSARELIEKGKELLNSSDYWEKVGATTLNFLDRFEAYVIAIGNGDAPNEGPPLVAAIVKQLREIETAIKKALPVAVKFVADAKKRGNKAGEELKGKDGMVVPIKRAAARGKQAREATKRAVRNRMAAKKAAA